MVAAPSGREVIRVLPKHYIDIRPTKGKGPLPQAVIYNKICMDSCLMNVSQQRHTATGGKKPLKTIIFLKTAKSTYFSFNSVHVVDACLHSERSVTLHMVRGLLK